MPRSRTILSLSLALSLSLTLVIAPARAAQPGLSANYPLSALGELLLPSAQWHPYPTAAEREFWEGLPAELKQAHLARAEEYLGRPWELLPASVYLQFSRDGNRSNYEEIYFGRRNRLAALVVAECIEYQGRFLDEIANGLWAIMEETSWCIPAHIGMQQAGNGLPDAIEPIVDLFAGETVGLLAWVHYLLAPELERVSPLLPPRLVREAQQRIIEPCLARNDFWWMSFETDHINNWNPWVNSNWLTAVLLLEQDPQRRVRAVDKIFRSLDRFLGSYHPDGGCDEGPGYWGRAGAALFDCLELAHSASAGKISIYDQPLVQNIGRYIYRAQVSGDYFINFADAPGRTGIDGDLVYRYGQRIGDSRMMGLGAWAAQRELAEGQGSTGSFGGLQRYLPKLAGLAEIDGAKGFQPLPRDAWLDGIQVMAARSVDGADQGLFLAAKGGHNAESHNHNDVGNFIVYVDGLPALIDAGVGTYTRQTFSEERYSIWTMQSAYHNLPTINGVMQREGREFAARQVRYRADGSSAELAQDLAGCYPPEAGVERWIRKVRLERGRQVRITDSFRLSKREGGLMLSLITPCRVRLERPGELVLVQSREGGPAEIRVTYDGGKLTPALEEIKLDDQRLSGVWGERLTRIRLEAPAGSPREDSWTVRIIEPK